MTNINPDKLIKGEPYLIEFGKNFCVGFFYSGSKHHITFTKDKFIKMFGVILLNDSFGFRTQKIKSLIHLKRGEVIK